MKFLMIALIGLAPIAIPFVILGLLERRYPAGPLKSARGWIFNIKVSLLYLAVPTLLGGLMAALILKVRGINRGGLINLDFARTGFWSEAAAVLIFLLIWDFFYYWWHRAQHEVKALWALHKLHHLDETLGVSSQMRVHWLEEIGRIPFIFIPMALIFNLPMHAGIIAVVLTAWTAFIHANLRLGLGRMSRVIAGPQVHRIHHSNLPRHFDQNYAALFPFYDVIFRTYYHPAADEYPPTGIAGEPDLRTVSQAFVLPFPAWLAAFRNRLDSADEVNTPAA